MNPALVDQAWSLIESARPADAAALLAPHATGHAPALVARGVALLDAGEPAEAARTLEEALALDPANVVARSYLALARWGSGDAPGAAKALDGALLFPQRGYIERLLRTFWPLRFSSTLRRAPLPAPPREVRHSTDYNRYHAHSDVVPERRRRRLAARLARTGEQEFLKARYASATLQLERAAELDPQDSEIALRLAFCLLTEGRSEQALLLTGPLLEGTLEHVAAAHSGRPLLEDIDPGLIVTHAAGLHDIGLHREALLYLAGVRHPEFEDSMAHFTAATCWLMLGREEAFRACLQPALTRYFLDTWSFRIVPFCRQLAAWLATEDAAAAAPRP